jgi:hypothetical protein
VLLDDAGDLNSISKAHKDLQATAHICDDAVSKVLIVG